MTLSAASTSTGSVPRISGLADEPLRGGSFSLDHLEQHAEQLAASLVLPRGRRQRRRESRAFEARIAENAEILRRAHAVVSAAVREDERLSSDAEWLLDNFNVVEEQLREISDDLPRSYYRELPKLDTGEPRVYVLAIELISHTDSALDEETIVRFINAVQNLAPLSIGEVWAFPIMLRLGLVENLRRLAAQMLANRECRTSASELIQAWRQTEECRLDAIALGQCAPLLLEIVEQLQDLGVEHGHRLTELERRFNERGMQTAEVIRIAHQRQAANQVSIGNVITSMRLISALDWMVFFESTNLADQVLRQDPAQIYSQMDSATRDQYRHAVEEVAKWSKLSDLDVAEHAISLARRANSHGGSSSIENHVGYYLVDAGRSKLEDALSTRPPPAVRRLRWLKQHPNLFYLGSFGLLQVGAIASLIGLAVLCGASIAVAVGMALLALLPISELALGLLNLWVTTRLKPLRLPKLEFREGVPAAHATMVVVPSMLTGRHEIESLVEHLELHYLANCEGALRFALLTDFADAATRETPGDEPLLSFAVEQIRALNRRYAVDNEGPFYLLHRGRRWNESAQRWMGWERKRGKLMEFNRWLLGARDTTFEVLEGSLEAILGAESQTPIRYIITLDADTQLPSGSARRLIGALCHPLNWPRFDDQERVISGYVILQPRVGIHLGSANRTWFSRIFANSPGIDPYATAASDVYQDLFGEGSFTGKGIYDLRAFEKTLDGVFPENSILSHDLIEGCHARVGLVSDIEFIDGYPSRYDAEARRQHRWARGDWQLLPWLFPWVPTERGTRRNSLTVLSRWKVVDNLRRSLVAPGLLVFLLVGWLAFPSLAALWSGVGLVCLGFPILTQLALTVRRWPRGVPWREYRRSWGREMWSLLLQTGFLLALLPHRSQLMLDAFVRTLFRVTVTRRRMLEWETAAATERRLSQSRWSALMQFWSPPLLAVGLLVSSTPMARLWATPFLLAWLLAPLLAHRISQPVPSRKKALSASQQGRLRHIARQTWSFFEVYVNELGNWLPPDNYQEYPGGKIAYRISPTNEGLYLVSALVGRDFGFLSLHGLVERWERNLDRWTKLDRLRGHFFNWYDTQTLKPLLPRYVSTVDSGNLAACFLTLEQGISELRTKNLWTQPIWQGVVDTIAGVEQSLATLHPLGKRRASEASSDVEQHVAKLHELWFEMPRNLVEWHSRLQQSRPLAARLSEPSVALTAEHLATTDALDAQRELLSQLLDSLQVEMTTLFPWIEVLSTQAFRREDPAVGLGELLGTPPPSEVLAVWSALVGKFEAAQNLGALRQLEPAVDDDLCALRAAWTGPEHSAARELLDNLQAAATMATVAAARLDWRLNEFAHRVDGLAREMEFGFLYNPQRKLFSIGFNVEEGHLDRAHYDMLASEARLASYLAIGKGDVDYRHWFRLGRSLTETAGQVGLLSWGGTMFEYLMPQLFQKSFEGSLIERSCRAAVARQVEYGKRHGVPWGISESAFGALASNSDYHYRSFGVPGLGLKRSLAKDMVVSPYSTLLALEIAPTQASDNLDWLAKEGGFGNWGYYDALDYTSDRLPDGMRCQFVRCYMAHHQGMSLLALDNLLHHGRIRRLFHAHPLGKVAELLLQERVPVSTPLVQPHENEVTATPLPRIENELVSRRLSGYETAAPRTHLLSNTQYSVMLTNTGGGYSQCRDVAVTRWRCDATRDHWGQYCYLRDPRTGRVWSATYQPTLAKPDSYEVVYSVDKAEFHRRDGVFETLFEVAVAPDCDAEVRQLKITNHGSQSAELEITSFGEFVLASPGADLAHPAFQKLFVETEFIPEEAAIVARRRPRDAQDSPLWAMHVLAVAQPVEGSIQYETSREKFIGRGRSPASPRALDPQSRLSGTTGAVLDPVFALRCRIIIPAHKSATVAFSTAVASNRDEALALADQFHEPRGVQRAFELALAYSQVELRHLHMSAAKAHQYQRLASALFYPDAARRAPAATLLANRQGQAGLWRYGLSGDRPILFAHVTRPEELDFVRDLLAAHRFWKSHGLQVELVIMNDYPGSYFDALHEQLVGLLHELRQGPDEKPVGVFLLRSAQIPRDDLLLLETAAMLVLYGERGALAKQLEPFVSIQPSTALTKPAATDEPPKKSSLRATRPEARNTLAGREGQRTTARPTGIDEHGSPLEFWNGWGGFAHHGREYHILLQGEHRTPMPWSNIIANPRFGCLVTEAGGGYTWAGNSRENKLTSWSNDPVTDSPSELLYLQDEATLERWRPLPTSGGRDAGDYRVQHGQGYSKFSHTAAGLETSVLISIAPDDPVKFVCLTLRNLGAVPRRLSITYFAEWVLGVSREQTHLHVSTSLDETSGALLANNRYHPDYPQQTAFLQVLGRDKTYTGDRTEFLGRNGDYDAPAALARGRLAERLGAGLDPCGVVQTKVALGPGGQTEVTFLLGAGHDLEEARALLARYSQPDQVHLSIAETKAQWDELLGALQVRTPDRAFDVMVNRWLLYQIVCCRLWARSAFYQAGGAYGFRDQLQDVMAVVYSQPELTRAQLLRAAARQYEEGDVQHWWHPPSGRGTRTRFSDDYLWLPLVTAHYIGATGDRQILDEQATFLHSPPLEAEEQERYELPHVSSHSASLYEHCRRTLQRAFRLGPHGLPLMGCGDWNDGFNKVGALGQGESVWVGWFLLVILKRFLPLMEAQQDLELARELTEQAETLRKSLEREAWDGAWYRRAYFDDGTPLGSNTNEECQIDSLAQTWAVFADADESRARQAMESVWQRLVRPDEKLVLLFTPPFDAAPQDPGYIKGYLPGIRENGGQYTHSALWVAQAFAALGNAERAHEVFNLINPVRHGDTPAHVGRYRVEPYVVAADVYGVPPHTGRGGWSWYTGSAAWMYRTAVESILGFQLEGNRLRLQPCVPAGWQNLQIDFRRNGTTYHLSYYGEQAGSAQPQAIWFDGTPLAGDWIDLNDDGGHHEIVVRNASDANS